MSSLILGIGLLMPKPKTVSMTIRLPAELRDRVNARAVERGDLVSQVVRDALRRYVEGKD